MNNDPTYEKARIDANEPFKLTHHSHQENRVTYGDNAHHGTDAHLWHPN